MMISLICLMVVTVTNTIITKANKPEVIDYTYDKGNTLWEIATRHCPNEININDFIREIEELNGIENYKIYDNVFYKVPIYEQ